jgi:hypothetical protein
MNRFPKVKKLIFVKFVIFGLLLGSCNGQSGVDLESFSPLPIEESAETWIDAPLSGANLPLAPYTLVFSGGVSQTAVDEFEIWVNGVSVTTVGPMFEAGEGASKYVYSDYLWTPSSVGSYLIEVRGLFNGEPGPFAKTLVQVVEADTDIEEQIEPISAEALQVIVIPPQDTNCRYGCSAQFFDIADTLLAGSEYLPLAMDVNQGFLLFEGPAFGERCWIYNEILDFQVGEELIEFEQLPVDLLPDASCPPISTGTPTSEVTSPPPSGTSPTDTPAPSLPQCSDGIDNDGDGFTDYNAFGSGDSDCSSISDNDESN